MSFDFEPPFDPAGEAMARERAESQPSPSWWGAFFRSLRQAEPDQNPQPELNLFDKKFSGRLPRGSQKLIGQAEAFANGQAEFGDLPQMTRSLINLVYEIQAQISNIAEYDLEKLHSDSRHDLWYEYLPFRQVHKVVAALLERLSLSGQEGLNPEIINHQYLFTDNSGGFLKGAYIDLVLPTAEKPGLRLSVEHFHSQRTGGDVKLLLRLVDTTSQGFAQLEREQKQAVRQHKFEMHARVFDPDVIRAEILTALSRGVGLYQDSVEQPQKRDLVGPIDLIWRRNTEVDDTDDYYGLAKHDQRLLNNPEEINAFIQHVAQHYPQFALEDGLASWVFSNPDLGVKIELEVDQSDTRSAMIQSPMIQTSFDTVPSFCRLNLIISANTIKEYQREIKQNLSQAYQELRQQYTNGGMPTATSIRELTDDLHSLLETQNQLLDHGGYTNWVNQFIKKEILPEMLAGFFSSDAGTSDEANL